MTSIYTERLLIRTMCPEDWQGLKEVILDFSVSPYAIYDHPMPVEDEEILKAAKYFAETGFFFSVFLKDTDRMIGYVCFHPEGENCDLGYCFHSKYHGKGYAYESCFALMDNLSQRHRFRAFTSGTALRNTPSCRLLKKLGFSLEKTEQVSFYKDSEENDIVFEGGSFIKELEIS